MSNARDPDERSDLDEDKDRGDVSREGFRDYDKEAHPKQVDVDTEEPGFDDRERASTGHLASQRPEARIRFDVHFRMMKFRI